MRGSRRLSKARRSLTLRTDPARSCVAAYAVRMHDEPPRDPDLDVLDGLPPIEGKLWCGWIDRETDEIVRGYELTREQLAHRVAEDRRRADDGDAA